MKKVTAFLVAMLVVGELLLIMVSWLLSATMAGNVRSLLSTEGIRWLLGSFVDALQTPVLVWLLLLAMAYGAVVRCRGPRDTASPHAALTENTYRASRARIIAAAFLVVYVGIVVLLTAVPHAVLLSASGLLWPSPFSASLVPLAAFGVLMAAILYGIVAGSFQSLADIYGALVYGLRQCAPLLPVYILLVQFLESLRFVLP